MDTIHQEFHREDCTGVHDGTHAARLYRPVLSERRQTYPITKSRPIRQSQRNRSLERRICIQMERYRDLFRIHTRRIAL